MLAVTQAGDGLDPKEPYGSQSCAIQCTVNMYGPADLENWKDIAALGKSQAGCAGTLSPVLGAASSRQE